MDNNDFDKNVDINSDSSPENGGAPEEIATDGYSENTGTQSSASVNENPESNYSQAFKEESTETARPVSFYSESFKKQSRKKGGTILQMIIVALVSSILGGGVVAAAFTLFVPSLNSSVKSYFGSFLSDKTASSSTGDSGIYKKVEIEKSDSPVTAIAEKVSPSIVGIKVTFTSNGSIFFGSQQGVGEGSGIIVRNDGYIMTNNHVVNEAVDPSTGKLSKSSKIEVILPNEPKKTYQAQIVARDSKTDLAVLKINKTGLPAAELGDSDKLKVGELAVAIGAPGGLDYMGSVTAGIISGLNREVTDNGVGERYIQTDAPINTGNSGGALVNSQGQVIGVNTLKAGTEDGYEGLGFAIPINEAKQVVNSLIENKYVAGRPPVLNVTINTNYNAEIAKEQGLPEGLYVDSVTEFGAAYRAGVRENDIITKFDGKRVKTFDELTQLRNKHKAGDKVSMEVYRNGEYKTVNITLEQDKS